MGRGRCHQVVGEDQLDQAPAIAKSHSNVGIYRVCSSTWTKAYDWICGVTESLTRLSDENVDLGTKTVTKTKAEIRDWDLRTGERLIKPYSSLQQTQQTAETSNFRLIITLCCPTASHPVQITIMAIVIIKNILIRQIYLNYANPLTSVVASSVYYFSMPWFSKYLVFYIAGTACYVFDGIFVSIE